jgi:MOSC domain-containing protein YiiM
VGDCWKDRGSSRTHDGSADPGMQLTIMNSRAISLIAQEKDRWQLAGDQLFIDMDLSPENMPDGTQLAIGSAVVAITDLPHLGCKKFASRFGKDAVRFVNSPAGRQLRLRGVNAKVVKPGAIAAGDIVKKI